MVEGPKVKLKKERIINLLRGKTLSTMYHCLEAPTLVESVDSPNFIGKQLEQIIVVGKEMFFQFANTDVVLRLHFGMNGTEILYETSAVNISSSSTSFSKHGRKQLTYKLVFDDTTLDLFDTAMTIKPHLYFMNALTNIYRDVMTPKSLFDFDTAIEKLSLDPRTIAEALMDQSIFPGLGNIIKCESLFVSRIHPDTPCVQLSPSTSHALIANVLAFSQRWYDSCLRNRSLTYDIYGKSTCESCKSPVRLVRQGQMGRITYYCPCCQAMSYDATKVGHNGHLTNNAIPVTSFETGIQDEHSIVSSAINSGIQSPKEYEDQNHQLSRYFTQPLCKCKQLAKLVRVRKEGLTKNRLFWGCSGPARRSCNLFAWADGKFPKCSHGSLSIIRRVLKPGMNNGRYFFCCASDQQSQQCKFFEWLSSPQKGANVNSATTPAAIAVSESAVEEPFLKKIRLESYSTTPRSQISFEVPL